LEAIMTPPLDLSGRALPHNLEAERSILGAILLDADRLAVAAALISPGDFFRDAHRRIFLAMQALQTRGEDIDFITVRHLLDETGHLDAVGGPAYLAALVDGMPHGLHLEAYARIVKDLAVRRQVIQVATKTAAAAFDPHDQDTTAVAALASDTFARLATPEPVLPPRTGRWAQQLWHDAPPQETIEGVAWAGLLTVLVAESGAGKTFVLLDAAAAVSAGLPWHGRTTQQGTVAYCAYEGDALGARLRAMHLHSGHRFEHLAVLRLSEPISPMVTLRDGEQRSAGERQLQRELEALQEDITTEHRPPLRLLIIDTVRASMTGNEDSSEHTAAYLRAVRRVLAPFPDAACVLAHHSGWQDGEHKKKRERGSSSWRGNVDATLYLETDSYQDATGTAELTLSALKVRDSERSAPLRLVRRRVDLNESDPRGQPLTSCVIERDARTREEVAAEVEAKTAQSTRAGDLKALQIMTSRAGVVTSQRQLQLLLGGKREIANDTLARLLQNGWVSIPEKQRQPYQVTTAGLAALNGGAHP
jgi:hypothetical protein